MKTEPLKFKKVVTWTKTENEFSSATEFVFTAIFLLIIALLLSPITVLVFWFIKFKETWKADRHVYWEQVK